MNKKTDEFIKDSLTPEEKAAVQYQTSVIDLKLKHVKVFLNSQSVFIERKDLKSISWSNQALTNDLFAETLKHRRGYVQRKSAPVDVYISEKIRDPIYGFKPFHQPLERDVNLSGVKDVTQMMAIDIGSCFMPRGKTEPHALTKSNIIFGTQVEGAFRGRGTLILLKDFKGQDKANKVTLSNPWQIDHSGYFKVYDDPTTNWSNIGMIPNWNHSVVTTRGTIVLSFGVVHLKKF
jgi:hypothetical protein